MMGLGSPPLDTCYRLGFQSHVRPRHEGASQGADSILSVMLLKAGCFDIEGS